MSAGAEWHERTALAAEVVRDDRYVAWAAWDVPHDVFLDGDRLRWSWDVWPEDGPYRRIVSSTDVLTDFLQMEHASAEVIVSFASHCGPLFGLDPELGCLLSRPGSPLAHLGQTCELCGPDGDAPFWEPLEGWRTIARLARVLLKMFGAVQVGEPLEDADRKAFGEARGLWEGPHGILNDWLLAGAVTPALSIAGEQPKLTFRDAETRIPISYLVDLRAPDLFGAVAGQIALAVGRLDGFALCNGCGAVFSPTRTPARGRRRYCQSCRAAGIPQRDASRDSDRRRQASTKDDEKVEDIVSRIRAESAGIGISAVRPRQRTLDIDTALKVLQAQQAAALGAADGVGSAVTNARDAGASWNDIASSLGMTKQAAHKRFSQREGD